MKIRYLSPLGSPQAPEASHGARPRPVSFAHHGVDKTNLDTPAAAQEPSGKGKTKATRGRKPGKECVVNPDSTTPK
jgi:hypothetical protein